MSQYESDTQSGDGEQQPWYVREVDADTGVGDSLGVPYTYEHVDEPPEPGGEVFRVVAELDMANSPMHKNVYFVEADRFPRWIEQHDETLFEQIVSVRPVSRAEAEREFTEFGDGD